MDSEKEYTLVIDLFDDIDVLFEEGEKIDKRKKKVYQEWKDRINRLIDMCNEKVGFKCYLKIKK